MVQVKGQRRSSKCVAARGSGERLDLPSVVAYDENLAGQSEDPFDPDLSARTAGVVPAAKSLSARPPARSQEVNRPRVVPPESTGEGGHMSRTSASTTVRRPFAGTESA